MGEMTHRQRVFAALSHQEPDRVPVDLGATRSTSIVVQAYERLNAHLRAKEEARIFSKWLNIGHPSQAMLAPFDIDTRSVSQGSPDPKPSTGPSSTGASRSTSSTSATWGRRARPDTSSSSPPTR